MRNTIAPSGLANPAAEVTGFPVSKPLVSGSKIGSFFPVYNVELGTNDVAVPIQLGRTPSGIIQIFTPPGGGTVTAGSNNGADWTGQQVVLQATVAALYGILVF